MSQQSTITPIFWVEFNTVVYMCEVWVNVKRSLLFGQLMQSCQAMPFSSLDWSACESESEEVASAVARCGQAMCQLRKLSISIEIGINPLPLLQALGDRDCPLEHVTVWSQLCVCILLVCVVTGLMMQCLSIRSWYSCQWLTGLSSGVDRSPCCRVRVHVHMLWETALCSLCTGEVQ